MNEVSQSPSGRLRIDVWADIVCPWCWVGKRRLEQAIEATEMGGAVEIVLRSFELGPRGVAPRPTLEMLEQKFRTSREGVLRRIAPLEVLASSLGLELDFARAISAPTFDAHRLLHAARARGLQLALAERLHRAHFTEGRDLSDHATLAALADEVGLPRAEAAELLASGAHAADVDDDEATARRVGVGGVPFAVIAGRYAIEGAEPMEVFAEVLRKARDEQLSSQTGGTSRP